MTSVAIIPQERIMQGILLIRGQKVLLDADLALLYGVTKRGGRKLRPPQKALKQWKNGTTNNLRSCLRQFVNFLVIRKSQNVRSASMSKNRNLYNL